jgi:hypothetical protein
MSSALRSVNEQECVGVRSGLERATGGRAFRIPGVPRVVNPGGGAISDSRRAEVRDGPAAPLGGLGICRTGNVYAQQIDCGENGEFDAWNATSTPPTSGSGLAMVERRRSLKNENRRIVETYDTRPNYQGATQPVFRFRPSPIFFARADRWAA